MITVWTSGQNLESKIDFSESVQAEVDLILQERF